MAVQIPGIVSWFCREKEKKQGKQCNERTCFSVGYAVQKKLSLLCLNSIAEMLG